MAKEDIYPFFKANIHERRCAAVLFRCLPLVFFFSTSFALIYGVLEDERLLLAVAAVLNLTMWLFLVSMSLFGIAGSWKVMNEVKAKSAELPDPNRSQSPGLSGDTDCAVHLVVLPNYKEDESMMAETLTCLAQAADSKNFHVCLAMEEREGDAGAQKAYRLQVDFKDCFAQIYISTHPADLTQEHLDLSSDPEVPGKASNLKYAVNSSIEFMKKHGFHKFGNVLLTVADADCLFHPCYFSTISKDFNMLREGPEGQQQWCMWQAPQLSYRDHWRAPVVSRVWTYVSSMYEFGGTSCLHWGGHHMVFSGYTLPLQLARDAESWDGDVIAEDHHAYLKNFFYSAHTSANALSNDPYHDILTGDGCQPMLQVRPVFLPVKSTPVISGEGYWQSWVERWHQAKRHSQGVAEFPYALLACWDIVCTLPLRSWSLYLYYKMLRVIVRLFCMHVLPICQAIALAVITVYWFWHKWTNTQIKNCPDTLSIWDIRHNEYALCGLAGALNLVWPIVVAFSLILWANYLFLLTGFLQPAMEKSAQKFAWHGDDGDIPNVWWACGSKRLGSFLLIAVDSLVFMPIIMVPYGLIALFLAYWHVCLYGNRFKYITAAKAVKTTGEYGTMSADSRCPPLSTAA